MAAAAGGTTTIVDLIEANLNEREKNINALKNKLEEGQNSVIDYTFHFKLNYLDNIIKQDGNSSEDWSNLLYVLKADRSE